MLGIGVLAAGRAEYYLDAVAAGREDYYLGAGEAPGYWLGHHASSLGLDGAVDAADLASVLEGLDPTIGERLDRPRANRTPGFDLTFSAPKSVSIFFALAEPKLAAQANAAHNTAVAATLEWLETNACAVRRGAGGAHELAGDGFVAAAFRHRTSRAGDPQLHTHVLVANLTRGPEGNWSAPDARHLFALAKTAGHLYQAQLRHELTQRLGLAWQPPHNGVADLDGIPRELIEDLSQRRATILARLDELGLHSARAAQIAALDTRAAKESNLDIDALSRSWKEVAAAHRIDQDHLRTMTGRIEVQELSADEINRTSTFMLSPVGLTQRTSTFDRRHVLQAWCNALTAGAPIHRIESFADTTLQRPEVAPLQGAASSTKMHRKDHRRMTAPNLGHRYTTHELLALELRLFHDAQDRVRDDAGIVTRSAIERALASRPTLDEDQRHLVSALTTSGRGVEIVVAPAGTGKTYALAAVHEAWTASGYHVIGCALAARAAHQLETTARIPSSTIAALTCEIVAGERLRPKTVLVVDEAAMAGTRTLAPLLDAAARDHAKIVLVGDYRQLPEIDAGGLLRGLDRELGAIRLHHNRRQKAPWEQRALTWLRDGDTNAALNAYLHNARISVDHTAAARLGRMASDAALARERGQSVLMLASRWRDVHDLNHLARRYMIAAGKVHGAELTIGGCAYQTGDRVMTLRNAKRIGVTNGTTGTIAHIDHEHRTIDLDTDDHKRVTLPAQYLDSRGIVHAYATTIHKAQGSTVDRALVLVGDDLTQERAYTAMSRGRSENRLYLVAHDLEHDHAHLANIEPTESLRAWLQRSEAQHLATDHGIDFGLG